ncbi:MAG: PBP1A family penicillin-binding protein [Rhodospirillaceae bacterium]
MAKKQRSKSAEKTPPFPPPQGRGWLGAFFKWTATLAVWGLIAGMGVTAWFAYDLPDIDDAFKTTRRPQVTVLASAGEVIHQGGDLYGEPVDLAKLPPALPAAVLATEDRRFYGHFGFDPIGLARAMWVNVRAGRIVQGGSTLTQQLAKNLFLTADRTVKRKVQEVMLALWLEHKFTKGQILTLYLNRVYLGAGTYGVNAAAHRYFGKPATQLNDYQSALIAGLLKAPSRYNPIVSAERAYARTKVVLANMVAAGYLTDAQAKRARQGVQIAARPAHRGRARHFVDWVLEALPDYVSAAGQDLTVKTTLDLRLQQAADIAIARALAQGQKRRVSEGALIAMTPNGAVRAMIGGRDYSASQFNRAVQAKRQPGSAFKPLVYLAALEAGVTPNTRFVDKPITIGNWSPGNFSGKYEGPVSLSRALAGSINTVAVQVAGKVGPKAVIKQARGLGITSRLPDDAGIALGTGEVSLLELTGAYAGIAAGGEGVWPHAIVEITDRKGNVLYKRQGSGPGRVADADATLQLTRMMAGVIDGGTGKRAAIDRPAAGKTGTSQNYRDAWFVGFTPQLVAGVWFGNDDGKPMDRVTGGGLPAVAWRDFMTSAHRGVRIAGFGDAPGASGGSFWRRLARLIDGAPVVVDDENARSGD